MLNGSDTLRSCTVQLYPATFFVCDVFVRVAWIVPTPALLSCSLIESSGVTVADFLPSSTLMKRRPSMSMISASLRLPIAEFVRIRLPLIRLVLVPPTLMNEALPAVVVTTVTSACAAMPAARNASGSSLRIVIEEPLLWIRDRCGALYTRGSRRPPLSRRGDRSHSELLT